MRVIPIRRRRKMFRLSLKTLSRFPWLKERLRIEENDSLIELALHYLDRAVCAVEDGETLIQRTRTGKEADFYPWKEQ
jgi:hypothetical protein